MQKYFCLFYPESSKPNMSHKNMVIINLYVFLRSKIHKK